MKNLLNLNGAQLLGKNEQQAINGGKTSTWCQTQPDRTVCGGNRFYICYNGACLHCSQTPFACQ